MLYVVLLTSATNSGSSLVDHNALQIPRAFTELLSWALISTSAAKYNLQSYATRYRVEQPALWWASKNRGWSQSWEGFAPLFRKRVVLAKWIIRA
jgi:hypothetical protein